MYQRMLPSIFLLVLFTQVSYAVKIGISKPVTVPENVTIEPIETTTPEPTSTSTSTTSTTSTTKIQTTKPTTTAVTTPNIISTSTTTSTTSTTPVPSTTSAPSSKNNTRPSPIRNQNVDYSGYFCICDLRHQHCDINCCCDIDCVPEELNSFDCHKEERRLEDFQYQQGLPPCKINEGWLCVFRSNFKDTRHKQPYAVPDTIALHQWPQLLLETDDLSRDQRYYKIGDPILLYNFEENNLIEYDIPFSLIGHHCQIFESIRHLKPEKTSCHASVEKVQNLEAKFLQKLCTSLLLEGPSARVPMDGLIKETQTEFIPIAVFRCTKELDCIPASVTNSSLESFEDSEYSSLIQTRIYHNITNLISCDVLFVRSDFRSEKVWQHYEVKFIHIDEHDEAPSNVSGPLGYNTGSPIIIGRKVLLNESADHIDSNLILNYFHPNRTESIYINIPRRRHDLCKGSHLTLNFGESILIQCSVQLDNSTELNGETNFTRVCGDLQSRSLKFLQVSEILKLEEDFFISILGYPMNRTDRWTKVEVRNYEHLAVVGAYLDKDFAFICQNMILGVKYEFLTVSDSVQGVPHQNVLKRVSIEVGKRHDLQFQLDEVISIPITFSAVFQDLGELSGDARWVSCCKVVLISLLILIYLNNNVRVI